MTNRYHADVKLFHEKFGLTTPPTFTQLPDDLHNFRIGFFREELQEYIDSCATGDLATAFDSLIDLIYIVSGASLLHGIDSDFDDMVIDTGCYAYDIFDSNEPEKTEPGFLTDANYNEFVRLMAKNIDLYQEAHELDDQEKIREALSGMHISVFCCNSDMGGSEAMWDELWDDVQRANMSKVRAERPSDSKRGSVWDVVKPIGWQAPDTEGILAKHIALARQDSRSTTLLDLAKAWR